MEKIILGNLRVELLSRDILRLERKKEGTFCGEDTFLIPGKHRYDKTSLPFTQEGNHIRFGDYELTLPAGGNSLDGVTLKKGGETVYVYSPLLNSGELPALDKTPEVFPISDTPRILLPEGGYSASRSGEYRVTEDVEDIYLLLCGKNGRKLRKLYVELTGRSQLVRLSTLGGWNSKYYPYREEEAKQLIWDYEKHGIPLDVMVIDTDWRSCEHGWGYDVNKTLFPDMKRFLDFAHSHGVEIMFNDHPEPKEGAHVFEPKEIAYREKNLHRLMEMGLDIWWYDRNWGTKLISPAKGLRHETLGMYLFEDITRHHWQKVSGSREKYRRPVIMGNAVDIANGSYLGIQDSASHRYSIQWTGDILCDGFSLAQEVDNLIRGGNNAIPYLNSDCGGHIGNPSKEQFIRWMQFGTLSPIFRPHCTNIVERSRDPWVYDGETLEIVREYNLLRYRLLPLIYREARKSYENGSPIFPGLGWEYPEDETALKCNSEYMLGGDLLMSPIGGDYPSVLEETDYAAPVKAVYYLGRELEGEPIAEAVYPKLDMVLSHTSPEKGVPVYEYSARFTTTLKPRERVQLFIRCDDGSTVWIDGEKVLEDKNCHSAWMFPLKILEPDREYRVEIEYFQGGGEACCQLVTSRSTEDELHSTYLPAGRWLDPFRGTVYQGGRDISSKYPLRETPLFIRLGSLIPLAYEAKNTKEQKWDRLVLDFYPGKDASDRGYLYEDDTETTAYQLGQFRKSGYEAAFDREKNAFVVTFHPAEGSFPGDRCFDTRQITVKYHLLEGADTVRHVTVNGEDHICRRAEKNPTVFPLSTAPGAPDSDTLLVSFRAKANEEYEICFLL